MLFCLISRILFFLMLFCSLCKQACLYSFSSTFCKLLRIHICRYDVAFFLLCFFLAEIQTFFIHSCYKFPSIFQWSFMFSLNFLLEFFSFVGHCFLLFLIFQSFKTFLCLINQFAQVHRHAFYPFLLEWYLCFPLGLF